ncbi:MAG: DUF4160 domain-containing protein [Bacteroidetes bacterium]|nr:MAG: DUF4160 domain-containing protein [Bacteroidota bacterium]
MPTLLLLDGFRFSFYSLEHNPPHVHVSKGDAKAKINLIDCSLIDNQGLKPQDLKLAIELVAQNKIMFLEKWNLYFNN